MGTTATSDLAHMQAALSLAARGLGKTWPNPSVGCVIVKDGVVVGRGRTAQGGRPHAETQALHMAGDAARGATAYVTLEPCSHHGQTPPCADALIAAQVARVVVAVTDPDPRVSGRGMHRLQHAGIQIRDGVLEAEAAELNAGFFLAKTHNRPLITVKLASTLDGRIASVSGDSQWITGSPARRQAHMIRANHDAVLVGIGTVLADDPDLTCRIAGMTDFPPVSVVVDGRLDLPAVSKLAQAARQRPVWVLCNENQLQLDKAIILKELGVKLIPIAADGGHSIDLKAAVTELARSGITRLMVEGGSHIVASFFLSDLVDRLVWFRAPAIMGGDGLPAVQGLSVTALAAMPRFAVKSVHPIGDDLMETYVRK